MFELSVHVYKSTYINGCVTISLLKGMASTEALIKQLGDTSVRSSQTRQVPQD